MEEVFLPMLGVLVLLSLAADRSGYVRKDGDRVPSGHAHGICGSEMI